ncbi:Uncharacterized protein K02A2.6 [Stylophora pistillata]|uniref:Uncharacterized protein K02A2.6 n=1 Tax=Stylophora pistillata TaxID=50429 RepID=A0A2B4SNH6_STYPI|nr:Uncharacterized protein K02A2.6 [Stylophora pistillata]
MQATMKDPTLLAVIDAVRTCNWFEPSKQFDINQNAYKALERVKEELTICSCLSVLLRGRRIIVPEVLQQTVIDFAHEGHQGITKTKLLLREVWFPGINDAVEKEVKSCLACQVTTPETKCEPLNMSPLPEGPWQQINADFKELSGGGYLLVLYDDFSRYPIEEVIPSVSAPVFIPRLHKVFAEFGVPAKVRTDNGPPFNGREFQSFAKNMGFDHRKITPNDHVPTDKLNDSCARATPHSSTGKPPATVLFNRPVRVKIPDIPSSEEDPASIPHRDMLAKEKMKNNADWKAYVKPSNLMTGDKVLVRRDPSELIPEHLIILNPTSSLTARCERCRMESTNEIASSSGELLKSVTMSDLASSMVSLLRGAGILSNITEIAEKTRVQGENQLADKLEMVKETNNKLETSEKEIQEDNKEIEKMLLKVEEMKENVKKKTEEREQLFLKRKRLNDECNALQKKLHCCDSLLKVVPKVNEGDETL